MTKTNARFLRYINKNFHDNYGNCIDIKYSDYLKTLLKKYYFYDFSNTFDFLNDYELETKTGIVADDIELVLDDILCNKVKTIVNCLFYDLEQRGVMV